jgi:hypothetical protein
MELTKGRNLIEHEQEINSRPARTWFQTTAEKAVSKSAFCTHSCPLISLADWQSVS